MFFRKPIQNRAIGGGKKEKGTTCYMAFNYRVRLGRRGEKRGGGGPSHSLHLSQRAEREIAPQALAHKLAEKKKGEIVSLLLTNLRRR